MTASAIVAALRNPAPGSEIGICISMPSGEPVTPEELWVEAIGCWVRADGSYASFGRARGGRRFTLFDSWRIRRAVRHWRKS